MLVRGRAASGEPRLGLAITKACARRAIDRNRIKRIARESFRLEASNLPSVDLIVLCNRRAPAMPEQRIRLILAGAWEEIRGLRWQDS